MRTLSERIFTVAMLFYTTAALSPLFAGSDYLLERAQGNPIAIGIQVGLYSLAAVFIFTQGQSFVRGALKIKWIATLVLLALASSAWSQTPVLTLRRSLLLLATTAFAVYFATRYDISEQLRLLAWALGLAAVLSFLFGIFLVQYGVDRSIHAGDWQGVFSHKNTLARIMVLSSLVFVFSRTAVNRALRWAGIAGSVSLLILSGSLTGMVVLALLVGAFPIYKLIRARFTVAVPVSIMVGMLATGFAAALSGSLPEVFDFFHRDLTLTGRTILWDAVVKAISKSPLFGYGFDGFWLGMTGESANVLLAVRWPALHAHNGFLDLWLHLGILGLGIFVVGYLALWRRALQILSRSTEWTPIWLCTCLMFTLLYNLTESDLVKENSIFWVLYTATAVNLLLYRAQNSCHARSCVQL